MLWGIFLLVLILNLIHIYFEIKSGLTQFSCEQFGLDNPSWLKYIVVGTPLLVLSGSALLALITGSTIFLSICAGGFLGDLLFTHLFGSGYLKKLVPGTNWYTLFVYTYVGSVLLLSYPSWWAILGVIPFLVYWPGFILIAKVLKRVKE
jgi:hypothetical protein